MAIFQWKSQEAGDLTDRVREENARVPFQDVIYGLSPL